MKTQIMVALGALACIGTGASAAFTTGSAYTVPQTGPVSVSFESQSAGATGALYFLGAMRGSSDITYTAASDSKNLGKFLFSNKGTVSRYTVELGLFSAGDVIHFAYLITLGAGRANIGDVFRTDKSSHGKYFGQERLPSTPPEIITLFGVEDIKESMGSDWDYNDLKFSMHSLPSVVPAPGTMALAGAGLLMAAPRRRKTA